MYPPLSSNQTATMNWRIKNDSMDSAVLGEDYMVTADNQISFVSGQESAKIAMIF